MTVGSAGDGDPRTLITEGFHQNQGEHKSEEGEDEYAALPHSIGQRESSRDDPFDRDARHHTDVELTYRVRELYRTPEFPHDFPKLISICRVQGFCQAYELKSEAHLGDDEVVIRSVVGVADRHGYQHVLSILPPDNIVVQQLSASRSRVHPALASCAGSKQEKAVVFAAGNRMGIQHSSPGAVVCSDAGNEVTTKY
nr:unnamed protein product [Spirometra erinaceieuropaei]